MLIHADRLRLWACNSAGLLIGYTLIGLLRHRSWEILLTAAVLSVLFGVPIWALVSVKRHELFVGDNSLRAPVWKGLRRSATEIPLSEIDLSQSRIHRFGSSILAMHNGRRIVLSNCVYRPRDIRALFAEIERRVQAPS